VLLRVLPRRSAPLLAKPHRRPALLLAQKGVCARRA
jgi:hypothetical protein